MVDCLGFPLSNATLHGSHGLQARSRCSTGHQTSMFNIVLPKKQFFSSFKCWDEAFIADDVQCQQPSCLHYSISLSPLAPTLLVLQIHLDFLFSTGLFLMNKASPEPTPVSWLVCQQVRPQHFQISTASVSLGHNRSSVAMWTTGCHIFSNNYDQQLRF